jgi:hypothetical protein
VFITRSRSGIHWMELFKTAFPLHPIVEQSVKFDSAK